MKRLLSAFRAFKKDETATLTVEFVILMPVLIFWFIGSVVFYDAFDARAGAQKTSYTLADIVSRQSEVSNDFIDQLLVLQNRMLPLEPVGSVRVSTLQVSDAGNLEVLWSYSTEGTALTIDDVDLTSLPPMDVEDSVVIVESYVPYVPLADWVGVVQQTWANKIVTQARFVDALENSDF